MSMHYQGQRRRHRPRSKPFPWVRLMIACLLTILFLLGAVLQILSMGNIIASYWLSIIPPLVAIIALLLPLFQWLFPLSPDVASTSASPPQELSATATTPSQTSVSVASVWNVPYPHNPFFIGREGLLTQLSTMLHHEKAASTQAISGLGGIGKTQLAIEYAYLNRDKYQYILWMTATTYQTLFTDFVALAELLALPEKDSQDQTITVEAVKQWLEIHSHWLLIVDNADDLELIRDFLPTGGKGHILITTRSQATGAIAQPIEVTKLETEDGALLLLHRARMLPLEAPLPNASEEERASARAIAHLLDGLPLALDQAGAYLEETGCSLSDYRERLQTQRAALLKERGRLFSVHPASVATTFSLSFQHVQQADPIAAELLCFFSFLSPEAIPLDLLFEGAPDLGKPLRRTATDPQRVEKALSILYSYSLIHRDAANKALSVHRLVQAILKDEMKPRTQRHWAERTVRAVNRAFPDVKVETWHRCRQLLPQALACMELIDHWHMSFPEAAQLLNQAASYLHDHAQYTEAELLYQRALAIREKQLGAEHPATATSLNNLALLYNNQGKCEQAEPLYQRALAICEKQLGAEHPTTRRVQENYAGLLQNTNRQPPQKLTLEE